MKVLSVSLHAAENFGGFVAGTINAEKHHLEIEETDKGVIVSSKACRKLVPWSNIRGIDYFLDSGAAPVVATR